MELLAGIGDLGIEVIMTIEIETDHDHEFGQSEKRSSERKTFWVVLLTFSTMFLEIFAGIYYGSMALLADGIHMASHGVALVITLLAYIYARKHSRNRDYTFGTGKVNFLGGFIGAILLAQFSIMMGYESIHRLISPIAIEYDQSIYVAIWGLFINLASMWLLKDDDHHHHHHHGHDHDHAHHHHYHDEHHHEDQNLKSAYLHVLADALTSALAIVALLCGKYYQITWMDPVMGIVGAILVIRWSISLLRITAKQLLDQQSHGDAVSKLLADLNESFEGIKITDLHMWLIGPGIFNLNLSLLLKDREITVQDIKGKLQDYPDIVHSTIEIQYED